MTKLRFGVTGLGRIGWEHCKRLVDHPDCTLAGVADPVAERRDEAAANFHCATFATHDELLRLEGLDAVVIATPTHMHRDMAIAASAAGKHILLEKPMAVTVAEAREIAQAAKQAHRVLTVFQPHRLMVYHQQAKQVIQSGKLGKVYHVRRGAFGWGRRNDWQTLKKFGGGMLYNHGAHFIDQLFDLTGRDVARMFCRLGRVASMGDTEDVVKLVYQTRQGVLGEMEINMAVPRGPFEFEVYGTHGVLWKEQMTLKIRYFRPEELSARKLDDTLAAPGRQYPRDEAKFYDETVPGEPSFALDVYANLARAIRTGKAPYVKPVETIAVMRMLERCRKQPQGMIETPI